VSAQSWRETGAVLAERYVAHAEEYAAVGITSADEYRRRFVRDAWPNVGQHVRRYIREGFRSVVGSA
jgi:hypothetical protein